MASNGNGLNTWKKFSAFQVFGDYVPMQGFRVLIQIGVKPHQLLALIERRAAAQGLLDPTLAQANVRAGLGLLRSGLISFAYATSEEVIVVVHPHVLTGKDTPIQVHNRLVSEFSASLSVLLGEPVAVEARLYEVPDIEIARRALVGLASDFEDATPLRSAMWLGAQLRGRGEPFHRSMVETLEEQSHLLQTHGVDMDALPAWWWRGVAATGCPPDLRVFDELPGSDELGRLVVM